MIRGYIILLVILFPFGNTYINAQNPEKDSLKQLLNSDNQLEFMSAAKNFIPFCEAGDTLEIDQIRVKSDRVFQKCQSDCDSLSVLYFGFYMNYSSRVLYRLKNQHIEAEQTMQEHLKEVIELGNKQVLADYYISLGIYKRKRSAHTEALGFYHKALDQYLEIKNYKGAANVLHNIANVFGDQLNHSEAIKYHRKAAKMRRERDLPQDLIYSWMSLCGVYSRTGELDSSKHYLSLLDDPELDVTVSLGILSYAYSNVGICHANHGYYDEAIPYYEKALALREEAGYGDDIANSKINLGTVLMNSGDLNSTEKLCLEGLEYGEAHRSLFLKMNACQCLTEFYEKSGRTDLAYNYYKDFIKFRDSSDNYKGEAEALQTQMNYEFEKERLQDSLEFSQKEALHKNNLAKQKAENEKQDLELQNKQIQERALYGGIALSIAFLIFVIIRLNITRRQKKEIQKQKHEVERQKELVETKNHEITESINYAKRLQEAILPDRALFRELLPKSFILYKPKDIVAGDFYWLERKGDLIFFAAADCTGHGVPGAMVSVVCSNALSKTVIEENVHQPAAILNRARELVIERFSRSGELVKDGMDISLACFNSKTMELEWSGANNPIWILKEGAGSLTEAKGDKQPIGLYDKQTDFTNHKFQLAKGDQIYLFSDGYIDQFGGESGKKLKSSGFKKLILKHAHLEAEAQCQQLSDFFTEWKGTLEQLDDVCVIGLRV